jgi:hypothetical protein
MFINAIKVIMFNLMALLITGVFISVSAADEINTTTVHNAGKMNDIRQVDFNNYTYQLKGYGNVKLHNGEAKLIGNCFSTKMLGVPVIYGDLTGDGRDEAVIYMTAQPCSANAIIANVLVYTMKNKKPALLALITEADARKVVEPNIKNQEVYFRDIVSTGIEGDILIVTGAISGFPRNNLNYKAILKYGVRNKKLILLGKPELVDETKQE